MANNEILFKPNTLILSTNTSLGMTVTEFKLYDTILQRCQYHGDDNFKETEISTEEIKSIITNNNSSTIKEIINILDKFSDISLKFKVDDEYISSKAISVHIYNEKTDTFKIIISDYVYNVLHRYNEIGYSPIDLKLVKKAKSYYTHKIYQLLRRWSREKKTIKEKVELDTLKEICDITTVGIYDEYKYFKRDILNKAIKEINEKLNMKVEFKEIRSKRKVAKIEFTITDYEPRKYNFEKSKIVEPKRASVDDELVITNDDIDSLDYMNLIDLNVNESIHTVFLQDFSDYKNYMVAVETASDKTLASLGSKTINKRNYKYFKTTLKNLLPSEEITL